MNCAHYMYMTYTPNSIRNLCMVHPIMQNSYKNLLHPKNSWNLCTIGIPIRISLFYKIANKNSYRNSNFL